VDAAKKRQLLSNREWWSFKQSTAIDLARVKTGNQDREQSSDEGTWK